MCPHTAICAVYGESGCASRRIACQNSSFRARHREVAHMCPHTTILTHTYVSSKLLYKRYVCGVLYKGHTHAYIVTHICVLMLLNMWCIRGVMQKRAMPHAYVTYLTRAQACSNRRMLTYAYVCSRLRTPLFFPSCGHTVFFSNDARVGGRPEGAGRTVACCC